MNFRTGHEGHGLEALILSSQTSVRLTKIPQAARHVRGRSLIRIAGPVDFFGGHVPSGKLLVFDAKQSQDPNRLRTGKDHLAEHQRLEICRYGEAGFVAGLLCECTETRELYWCDWRLIRVAVPSIPWRDMDAIGSSKFAVQWDKIIEASNAERWARFVVGKRVG